MKKFAAFGLFAGVAFAQTFAPRSVPARTIPVPDDVSPELQKIIAKPVSTSTSPAPKTTEEWKNFISSIDKDEEKGIPVLEKRFQVSIEPGTIAGVPVFHVKPDAISESNKGRLLVHVHGGAYVLFGGLAATSEAILVAHYTGIETVSIDYRMPPDAPFPAAVDDSVAV